MPRAAQIDQGRDKRLLACAVVLARTATTHGAITWCLENRPWDFAAVLYNGIDQLCHLFMAYHPPQRAGVSAEDFDLYQQVVTAAYQFHDMMLGRLLQLAGEETTVLIVSDHGYRTALPPVNDPAAAAAARTLEALSLEHRPQGICLMHGPHVRQGEIIEGASLLDVTPTVLTLLGLPIGADMDGRPWVEMLDLPAREGPGAVPIENEPIPSWDCVAGGTGTRVADLRESPGGSAGESPAESLEAVRHLIALGYIDPPDDDVQEAIDRTLAENRFNLARSLLDARQPDRAIQLLEGLMRDCPGHPGYNAVLFEAYHAAGRSADSRRIAEAMWARGHRGPLAHLAMAAVDIAERKPDAALRHLEEAKRMSPDLPGLPVLAGRAWLRLRRWDEAANAFAAALRLDADDESAWHGQACVALGRGENEHAAEHVLRAVGLRGDYAEAHYHLGVALSRLGRPQNAESAFRRCLSLRPGLLVAYGRLLDLYEEGGPLADVHQARLCRQRANDILISRRLRQRSVLQGVAEGVAPKPATGSAASSPQKPVHAASAPWFAGAVPPPAG